jgi:hypothetical protein
MVIEHPNFDSSRSKHGKSNVAHGFALLLGRDDARKIELDTPVYDARYAWCQRQAEAPRAGA